ncbi:MAG: hypothetical protein H7175_16870 [Burkholderiales bacterium]|nr:hypothetical protein [Anaerolineae bacterium]
MDTNDYAQRSQERFANGDIDGGFADLDEAIRLDPHNPAYYWTRGMLHYEGDEHALAVADFTAIIELSSDERELEAAYRKIAICDEILGDTEASIAAMDWVIDQGYGDAELYQSRAHGKRKLGYLDGAIQDLTTAQQMASADIDSDILLLRAQTNYEAGYYSDALHDLTHILSANETRSTYLAAVLDWRGQAYFALNQRDAALTDFNMVMQLSGGQPFTDAAEYMRAFHP